MAELRQVRSPKQLLVEGRTAHVFFRALLKHLDPTQIQVQDFSGTQQLAGFLKALSNAPGFADTVTSLGIVRDAEDSAQAAFQSVCGALDRAGLPVPREPLEPVGEDLRIRVMILPDCHSRGMLETLCLRSVRDNDVMRCVTEFFDCVRRESDTQPANMDKARTQVFLATRRRPGLLVSQAADAGYWPWDHPAFEPVRRFLSEM